MVDSPLFTETFEPGQPFIPPPDSAYVFAETAEERSRLDPSWFQAAQGVRFLQLTEGEDRGIVEWSSGAERHLTRLRSADQIDEFWSAATAARVYLDITGLSHSTWAPLLRGALRSALDVRVVYAEPVSYSRSSNPTEGEFFDLSERTGRIGPLPGFASLSGGTDSPALIALLGFEGNRFFNLQEHIQAAATDIIPVIGVPGFRIEYPLHTFFGNRITLRDTRCWQNAHLVRADCPFSVFYLLQELSERLPSTSDIKVAPIGTKPHAVGAVLFVLSSSRSVELVYDNPKRKAGRTSGAARVHVYHVGGVPVLSERLHPAK